MGSEIEVLSSMVVMHPERLRAAVPHETLVITGSPRGGTSIVAYALLRSGYFLGHDVSALNHEDREIAGAFKENTHLLQIIESRNQQHQRWGFKYPKAALKLQWLVSNLRNPVAIIVYRNPLAIARSILNRASNFEQTKGDLERALMRGLDRMTTATSNSFALQSPVILIDIDHAMTRPEVFVAEFFSQLSIDASQQLVATLAQEIRQPGYKRVKQEQTALNRSAASKDGIGADRKSIF